MKTRKQKRIPRKNVPTMVHRAWLMLKGFGDTKNIQTLLEAEGLPHSQPTVTLAINHGFCKKPRMEEVITQYYNEKKKKTGELTESQKELLNGMQLMAD